jgi:hypothetical protein
MKARCSAFLLIMILPAPALADTLESGADNSGTITRIGKGVKELGFDSMLVVGYDKTGEASSLKATLLAGPTFRYFIRDNLSLAVNGSFLFKSASAGDLGGQTDIGGLGTISAGYYASLGRGMFLEPLIGVGGFFGNRTIGKDPAALRSSIFGGTGRAGLGLVFYPSSHFNLHAGPEAVVSFGKSSAGTGEGFLSMDAGFNVGMTYVF